MQVEAIRSGVNPGLTMVVGPPGTGKTDTAVQAGAGYGRGWDLGSEKNGDMCRLIQIETVITWRLGVILSLSNLSA